MQLNWIQWDSSEFQWHPVRLAECTLRLAESHWIFDGRILIFQFSVLSAAGDYPTAAANTVSDSLTWESLRFADLNCRSKRRSGCSADDGGAPKRPRWIWGSRSATWDLSTFSSCPDGSHSAQLCSTIANNSLVMPVLWAKKWENSFWVLEVYKFCKIQQTVAYVLLFIPLRRIVRFLVKSNDSTQTFSQVTTMCLTVVHCVSLLQCSPRG